MESEIAPSYRNCYAFPYLGGARDLGLMRIGGAGLANLLFVWSRCLVEARRHGLRRISPTWLQILRGPWVRNDPDKRTYHDLFDPAPDEVTGISRLRLLAGKQWVPEEQLGKPIPEGSIVSFRDIRGLLLPSIPYRDIVCEELLQIVRAKHKRALQTGFSPDVAIHVRLGDYSNADFSKGNTRLDVGWYIGILKRLRGSLGSLSAAVFSDGTDEELEPLLTIDGVTRVTFGSSIADIIGLSQARIFIASGSTFSMWPSFIGQMPTVWFPGRLFHPILEDSRKEIETHLDLPAEFIARCENSLERAHPVPFVGQDGNQEIGA
ncbi:MAG: alpha-1,2-fucosyltransferase [Bryobacteraceae bacterium]|jgi:hypothetical protein